MVVVDQITKFATFIPCTTRVTTKEMALLENQFVFSKHGFSREIISDKGPQFTSKFWHALCDILKIKPCQYTAYHPQSDRKMERLSQILEQWLRCYTSIKQDDWCDLLPIAMMAYNDFHSNSIGNTPTTLTKDTNQLYLSINPPPIWYH